MHTIYHLYYIHNFFIFFFIENACSAKHWKQLQKNSKKIKRKSSRRNNVQFVIVFYFFSATPKSPTRRIFFFMWRQSQFFLLLLIMEYWKHSSSHVRERLQHSEPRYACWMCWRLPYYYCCNLSCPGVLPASKCTFMVVS